MGAVLVSGVSNFVDPHWAYASLFVTGPGVIITLLFIPGGIGQLLARSRDAMLRGVARRRGIHVPSLEGNEARA